MPPTRGHLSLIHISSYQLFDLVRVEKRPEVEYPRSYRDYTGSIRLDARPAGVDVGFLCSPYGEISWNQVPEDAELFR